MITSESYLHAHTQYRRDPRAASTSFVQGLIHLYVTMTIHTAHAQKHFSPETKSKVRPKKKFARTGECCHGSGVNGPSPLKVHIRNTLTPSRRRKSLIPKLPQSRSEVCFRVNGQTR